MDEKSQDRFLQLYRRLIVEELRARLAIASDNALQSEEIRFLIQTAAVIAFEPHNDVNTSVLDGRGVAYDVATRLAEAYGQGNQRIIQAADFLLARLGNFPGRELLRKQLVVQEGNSFLCSPALTLEALAREAENTVEFPRIGRRLLTDFQVHLADSLRRSKAVSVSAPTSAGKSFILAHDILTSIAERPNTVLVYIVPTRALIQQVTLDLLQLFRAAELPNVIVSAAPIAFTEDQVNAGLVYVLTQERLVSLLGSSEFTLKISKVYVDEAQEIGDEDRGLILDSAIREVIARFADVRVCFASPLTKNPGYLFGEFSLAADGEFFTETYSPVSQVLVRLEPVKGKTKAATVSVVTPLQIQPVGQVQLPFKFTGVWDRLAGTAKFVRKPEESVIIFANRPHDAMEIAEKLAEDIEDKATDKDVLELIDFVKTHVHPRYALADTLIKGVAFHYGRMPHIIRNQVEELLRARKLQYVVCTSTLLQGVNLPARHIIVLAPKQGSGKAMSTPAFWNLAGRAGRLRENFRGYVWCVDPLSWETQPFDGERLSEIKSAFQSSLEDGQVREAATAVLDNTAPLSMVEQRNRVEQFLGKAFSEFTLQQQRLSDSTRVPENLRSEMAPLDERLEELAKRLNVPSEVCLGNAVISPTLLNDLWDRFVQQLVPEMIPADPFRPNSLEHFRVVFRVIDEVFIGTENDSWKYYAPLAYFWVMGQSLKELIENRLHFYNVKAEKKPVNKHIRELLDAIEQTIRFTYVKYMKAYNDVLRAFLIQRDAPGDRETAEGLAPWDLYLEFGARDRVLLMLMSIGVSRTTAILIRKAITTQSEISREECWSKIENLPLRVLSIPAVCKAEIRQLTGNTK